MSKDKDTVEVVRCRDCTYGTHGGTECLYFADYLDTVEDAIVLPADVEPDGFCAWGERREG